MTDAPPPSSHGIAAGWRATVRVLPCPLLRRVGRTVAALELGFVVALPHTSHGSPATRMATASTGSSDGCCPPRAAGRGRSSPRRRGRPCSSFPTLAVDPPTSATSPASSAYISAAGGDIVHQDDQAPKIPGCSNDFVLVKVQSWMGGNEGDEFVGVGACFGPKIVSKEKQVTREPLTLTDPIHGRAPPKNKITC